MGGFGGGDFSDIGGYFGSNSETIQGLKAKQEENQKLLERLVSVMTKRNVGKYEESTVDFINALQEQEYMKAQMRRCRSFREIREMDEYKYSSGEDVEVSNFISQPNSPREKEML